MHRMGDPALGPHVLADPRPVLAAFAAQPERAVRHAQPHALVPALLRPPLPAPAHSPRKTEFGPPLPVGERRGGGLAMSSMGMGPSGSGQSMNTIRAYSRRARSALPRPRRKSGRRRCGRAGGRLRARRRLSLNRTVRRVMLARQQANSSRKLNVAQAAKEAGQEYASLSEEEKEPYKRRSQAAKDVRELALASYMRTLTPTTSSARTPSVPRSAR
ncbi:hypothetical protein B0H14DRAFT_3588104 [Mycena olivaceomarginata]|nr:hypothetical protein B0H14DRAFT_3588104 [Mycena olivaceomarginata]